MARYRLLFVNLVLLFAAAGAHWGRRIEAATIPQGNFLQRLSLPFGNWSPQEIPVRESDLALLQPDALVIRRYRAPGYEKNGLFAELAVIAGHRKRTVHTPGFCMAAGGWELVTQRPHEIRVGERVIPSTRAVMSMEGYRLLTTYFFTDGSYSTRNLAQFQVSQFLKRLRTGIPMGAVVRVIVPIPGGDERAAEQLADRFIGATVPTVMASLRSVRLEVL